MPVSEKEWREFAVRVLEQQEHAAKALATLVTHYEHQDRRIELLFEKLDPAIIQLAVLEDRERKRANRESSVWNASLLALSGAVASVMAAVFTWLKGKT